MQICNSKNGCTGCGACACLCPMHCITVELNDDGFRVPVINAEKCINCGKCAKICPTNIHFRHNYNLPDVKAYSYTINDAKILQESSSGGGFTAIAEEIISCGGVVFGAEFDESFNVLHVGVDKISDLNKLRGSKYVESDTRNTYLEAKKYIDQGRPVLYIGTPCQIAGLYASLEYKKYENLYTIDLLCHGVPSASLLKSYFDYLGSKYGKIVYYSFRDKTKFGWGNWGNFVFQDKKCRKHKKAFVVASDYYYSLYFKECNFRESCYQCKYATIPRIGDVTLGDCWGVEHIDVKADLKNGVSLILVNNEKGKELLSLISPNGSLTPIDVEIMTKYNGTIVRPSKRPNERDTFYCDFKKYGFEDAARLYCKVRKRIPISRYFPTKLKNKLKKFLRLYKK